MSQMAGQRTDRSSNHEEWCEDASGGSGSEGKRPHEGLDEKNSNDQPYWCVAAKKLGDIVVPDAEAPWENQAADSYADASERRPPHPVNMRVFKNIFKGVHHTAHDRGDEARQRRRGKVSRVRIGWDECRS